MCNINLIINKNRKISGKIANVMDVISYKSFLSNSHGEGCFFIQGKEPIIMKSEKKIIYRNIPSWIIATHQRFATSGHSIDYIHPFENENIILMHNGVIQNEAQRKKDESDTFGMFTAIGETADTEKALISNIKNYVSNFEGSYSVLIYHKHTEKIFYFKNSRTDFYFTENNNYLIASTDKNNVQYAGYYLTGEITKIKNMRENHIIDIFAGKSVGKITVKKAVWINPYFSKQYLSEYQKDLKHFGYGGVRDFGGDFYD
jgi:predicted glutamine amidotransferase